MSTIGYPRVVYVNTSLIIDTQNQTLESYDQDSYKTVDYLLSTPTCTGRIGATGMCLGGHLALRAAVSLPSLIFFPLNNIPP